MHIISGRQLEPVADGTQPLREGRGRGCGVLHLELVHVLEQPRVRRRKVLHGREVDLDKSTLCPGSFAMPTFALAEILPQFRDRIATDYGGVIARRRRQLPAASGRAGGSARAATRRRRPGTLSCAAVTARRRGAAARRRCRIVAQLPLRRPPAAPLRRDGGRRHPGARRQVLAAAPIRAATREGAAPSGRWRLELLARLAVRRAATAARQHGRAAALLRRRWIAGAPARAAAAPHAVVPLPGSRRRGVRLVAAPRSRPRGRRGHRRASAAAVLHRSLTGQSLPELLRFR